MTRNVLLVLAIVLIGARADLHRASAATLLPDLGAGPTASTLPHLQGLKEQLADCCDNPGGAGSSGPDNTGTNNIGIGNTGTNNIGIGNSGSRNIGFQNGSTGNLGAFNGLGNASRTSGNHNIGTGNGNGNTSVYSGNGNFGIGNGNGNASAYSGNGNVGAFNGNLNGIGSGGDTTTNGNNNVGVLNGNLNGIGNGGVGNGSYNGNNNVGFANGNLNGNGNVGAGNGNNNGNNNAGAFNGNSNGSHNVGSDSGNTNGNDNFGFHNGNQNGNDNVGAYNGNTNGNANVGRDNGNWNGNGNVGAYNGNWNGNNNVNGFNAGLSPRGAATPDPGASPSVAQQASLTTLTPNPTASDGEAVGPGAFEKTYDFTLNETRDVQFGAISLSIFDFDLDLCSTAACQGSEIINSGHVVGGLLSIAGGWQPGLGAGTYYLLVSGFGARGGGAYFVGIIASPPATAPIPGALVMLLTGLAALAYCFRLSRARRAGLATAEARPGHPRPPRAHGHLISKL
jgi:hypothetical protein